jgi:hypothetical protein
VMQRNSNTKITISIDFFLILFSSSLILEEWKSENKQEETARSAPNPLKSDFHS